MTLGQKIRESRKEMGITAEALGGLLGLSASAIWKIENDQLKGGPDAETVVKIANVLNDNTILLHYLEENPVYREIIPRIFPELNNIRRDPAIIFTRLAREMDEAKGACDILAEIFSNADYQRVPRFDETFVANMEQIIDVKRGVEILELQLICSQIMTEDERRKVYERQQAKCEANGHHKAECA